jgi:DNA-binding HxlR family transcriptional regulator
MQPTSSPFLRFLRKATSAPSVWSLWALSELTSEGPLRFSRLLESVDCLSQKSLAATLRRLERDGLVRRSITVQVPIRVDYEATALGHELIVKFHPF